MDSIYIDLCNILGEENVLVNEDMKNHTTFRAGGAARYFVTPNSVDKVAEIISYLEGKAKYYVIGNGSNLLVRDEGFDGIIVKIGQNLAKCKINGNIINCEAGAFVSKIANVACENNLSGLEFAAGIPGTIGGAVAMNAGAYGGEFKDVILKVTLLDKDGRVFSLTNSEMNFSYRESVAQKKEYIVLAVEMKLNLGRKEDIFEKMNKFLQARKEKQPLEYPSAGSTFKRPEGYFAGKLIMDAGLRGHRVGEAMVSEKHCGFVINKGNATATDILKVMEDVKIEVKKKFDVDLEPEIKVLG